MAETLQNELLSIPGIAHAEFEGSEEHPVGVRVQLAAGADPDLVGQEVQRVLASHGMRSQMAHDEPESFLPPGSVVNLSDYENPPVEAEVAADDTDVEPHHEAVEADLEVMSGPPPAVELPAIEVDAVIASSPDTEDDADRPESEAPESEAPESEMPEPEMLEPRIGGAGDEPGDELVTATAEAEEAPEFVEAVAPGAEAAPVPAAIAGVAVDEDGIRVHVTVKSSDGRIAVRSVPATPYGLDDAAAQATVELAAPDTMPRVIAVVDGTIEGAPVVTVMLEGIAGRRFAGSSIIQGSRAYAVARATWAALQA